LIRPYVLILSAALSQLAACEGKMEGGSGTAKSAAEHDAVKGSDGEGGAIASCPAVAPGCPEGCDPLLGQPLDAARGCLGAWVTIGCLPAGTTLPPRIGCVVVNGEFFSSSPVGAFGGCSAADQDHILHAPPCSD
jgi:hypothetical protein